jgi:hypothetical protein
MLNEDAVPPFHQSNTSCVSNGVAEHDFLWKITNDVLTQRLWNLECTTRVVGDYVWTVKPGIGQKSNQQVPASLCCS